MKKRILRPLPGMDLPFLILVLTLVGFGLVMLASASSAVALYRRGDAWAYLRPQLLYAALGLCGMWLASRVDYHIFHKLAWPLLGLSLILLAAVLFMPEYNGCRRWLVIPGFGTLQPSEIAKFAVVLVFSHIISLNHDRMHSFAGGVLPFGLILGVVTVLMLLGTAAGEGADKTVINRINAPDVSADFAFAEDADLLEIIFPQILDCDAAFLRCGGETMLIDCATSGQARRILNMFKQLGITHVDKIVNTHPHADHIGGFAELIKEITVDELWLCFPAEETVHCANAMKAAERTGVAVRMFGDGDTLTLGTATMQVWMLDKPEYTRLNDRSAQIMLTFGQRKMLFSADLEQKGQNGLIEKVGAEMLKADVLKYPHHGLQALTPEYRAAVSPELAIVTCNQRETEGKKYIRRTALDTVWTVPGFVHLMTDGETWVCDRIVSDVKY